VGEDITCFRGVSIASEMFQGNAVAGVILAFSDRPFAFGLCLRPHRGRSAPLLQRFVEICRRLRQPGTDYLNTR